MKRVFGIIVALVLTLSVCSCGKVNYDIENDIEYIKNIFACVNLTNLEEMCNGEISEGDLEMSGTFAGIDGTYEIELYEENDEGYIADDIYAVHFTWDYNQEVPITEIAEVMTEYLGEPGYSDIECGNYYWLATEMDGITKFSNVPSGNCFDVDIYGDDCCISFGLSTTI